MTGLFVRYGIRPSWDSPGRDPAKMGLNGKMRASYGCRGTYCTGFICVYGLETPWQGAIVLFSALKAAAKSFGGTLCSSTTTAL